MSGTGMTSAQDTTGPDADRPSAGRRAAAVGWVIFGLALAFAKAEALGWLIHRGWAAGAIVFAVLMVVGWWRGRPLRAAWFGGVAFALLLHGHRVWVVLGLGAGAIAALALISVGVGALLSRLDRGRPIGGKGWLGTAP